MMSQIRSLEKLRLPLICGLFVILTGLMVIFGWHIDSLFLKSLIPGFISMKVNTAIALILFGTCLLLLGTPLKKLKMSFHVARALTFIGIAIGIATLAQYVLKIDLGIDEFFYKDIHDGDPSFPSGRLAPITAINFIFLGIGLFVSHFSKTPKFRLSQTLFFLVALSSFQALVEYLLGMQTPFGLSSYTRIAIHTALAFILLSVAFLSLHPKRGLVRIFLSLSAAGQLSRSLVLSLIFMPPIFKFLVLAGEHFQLLDSDFSSLFRSIISITFFVVLVLSSAESLYRSDRLRKRSNRMLSRQEKDRDKNRASLLIAEATQSSESRLRMIFDKSFDAIVGFNSNSEITEWNTQAENMYGWTRDEMIGKNLVTHFYPEEQWATRFRNFAAMCNTYDFSKFDKPLEVETLTKSGKTISVRMGISQMHIAGELLFIALIQDISEAKQTQNELLRSREQALNATKSKSEFLANMSHEIRTPMNGVIGMATVLLDSPLNESQRESAKLIKQSAESLLTIIGGILDHSKIEAGKLELENRNFNFSEVAQDIIRILKISSDEKGILLKLNLANVTQADVLGDANRIRQILVNFLGNAIKFTEIGEVSLNISTTVNPDGYILTRFEIIDSGPGLSEEDIDKLFQPYGQTEKGMKKGGTGLGLYISSELIRLMNGRYGIESTLGVGSTFWFEIPFKEGEKMMPALTNESPQILSGHILIAEDQVINQRVIGSYLAKLGVSFDIAVNGALALQMWENAKYDLILMDCRMPIIDGYDATVKIREKEKEIGGRIPIIALSAEISTDDRQRCLDLGMDEFVGKPVDFQKFYHCLKKWLTEEKDNKSFVIDETALKKLSGFSAGDQSLVDALIEEFSKTAPQIIDDMHLAAQNSSLKSISDLAHSLKSTSSTLGLIRVAEMCQILEALESIPTNFISLISRLEVEILLAETDLSRLKSNHP